RPALRIKPAGYGFWGGHWSGGFPPCGGCCGGCCGGGHGCWGGMYGGGGGGIGGLWLRVTSHTIRKVTNTMVAIVSTEWRMQAPKKKTSIPSDVDWIPYWIWSPVAIVNVYPVQLLMGRSTFSPTWNETVCVLPVWYAAAGTAKARRALSTKATDTPEFQGHRIPSSLDSGVRYYGRIERFVHESRRRYRPGAPGPV